MYLSLLSGIAHYNILHEGVLMILFLNPKQFKSKMQKHKPFARLIWVIVFLMTLCWIATFLEMYFEKVSFIEAVWQIWQTVATVGYGNQPAASVAGRINVMIFGTIGIGALGALFTTYIEFRNYKKELRRLGMTANQHRCGYVIFNFPGAHLAKQFIHEIRGIESDAGICFVDDRIECLPESIAALKNIHFIRGAIIDKKTFEKANLSQAKMAVIFPSEPDNPSSDAATKTIVEIISDYNENIRIVHVLIDQANEWLFQKTRSTQVLHSLSMLALVQECQDPHSAAIAETLFSNHRGANPVTVSFGINNHQWGAVQQAFLDACRNSKTSANILAVIHDGVVELCPDSELVIKPNDLFSIAVHNGTDLKKLGELTRYQLAQQV